MSYPSSYYSKAQEIIDSRRQKNSMQEAARYNEITEKLPQAAEILSSLAGTTARLANIILSDANDKKARIEALKNENLSLQDKLNRILVENGYPSDYLDRIFSCKECEDTGVANGKRCSCFLKALKQIASVELSKNLPMGLTCFESFDLRYYSDSSLPELNGRSPREIMKQNYDFCKEYAENFCLPYKGIIMTGGTGLGKTHLSLSVAKVVIDKGYSAVYGSVPDLFGKIEAAHFGKETGEGEVMQTIKECDLLVLDDLGAEFSSQFYVSCLYDIINTRLNFGRPVIVNTNLSASELQSRYSDRIASRLLSMKRMLFCGEDIRVKLKSYAHR